MDAFAVNAVKEQIYLYQARIADYEQINSSEKANEYFTMNDMELGDYLLELGQTGW